MTVNQLLIDALSHDLVELDAARIDALSEAATYRQMLLIALGGWEAEKVRADAASQRVRQLMNLDEAHDFDDR